jgi:hypothetical protein
MSKALTIGGFGEISRDAVVVRFGDAGPNTHLNLQAIHKSAIISNL